MFSVELIHALQNIKLKPEHFCCILDIKSNELINSKLWMMD